MALAKKGYRTMVVDDIRYRYKITMDICYQYLTLTIAPAENDGCRLAARFPFDLVSWARRSLEIPVILPAKVRAVILDAKASGWRPETPGSSIFELPPELLSGSGG